jgi:hypothetical protein
MPYLLSSLQILQAMYHPHSILPQLNYLHKLYRAKYPMLIFSIPQKSNYLQPSNSIPIQPNYYPLKPTLPLYELDSNYY